MALPNVRGINYAGGMIRPGTDQSVFRIASAAMKILNFKNSILYSENQACIKTVYPAFQSTGYGMTIAIRKKNSRKVYVTMKNHIYKKLEIDGSPEKGIQDAIEKAIAGIANAIRNMR